MPGLKRPGKDLVGAALLAVVGTGVMALSRTYDLGTPRHMGPGLVPFALGALMAAIGLLIGLTAGGNVRRAAVLRRAHEPVQAEWRGWICILGGIGSFVVLGQYGGLLPASFATVFISALGDREATLPGSAILAAAITTFGVVVFHYGLQLQLPLFQWG